MNKRDQIKMLEAGQPLRQKFLCAFAAFNAAREDADKLAGQLRKLTQKKQKADEYKTKLEVELLDAARKYRTWSADYKANKK